MIRKQSQPPLLTRSSSNSNSKNNTQLFSWHHKLGIILLLFCVYTATINHVLLTSSLGREQTTQEEEWQQQHRQPFVDSRPSQRSIEGASLSAASVYQCSYPVKNENNHTDDHVVTIPQNTPTFIMIGVQKSGTTALMQYCRFKHPFILDSNKGFTRELHFFDTSWNSLMKQAKYDIKLKQAQHKHCFILEKYMTLFQTKKILEQQTQQQQQQQQQQYYTFEKTPSYFANSQIPQRIKHVVPWTKLILVLRNPIDRLYSQYKMTIRDIFDLRNYTLEQFIYEEIHAMKYEFNMTTVELPYMMNVNVDSNSPRQHPNVSIDHPIPPNQWKPKHKALHLKTQNGPLSNHILVRRGLYNIQLQYWLKYFKIGKDLMIINYDDLIKKNTHDVVKRIWNFCNIPIPAGFDNDDVEDNNNTNDNTTTTTAAATSTNSSSASSSLHIQYRVDERKDYRPMNIMTRQYLQQFYLPYNQQLEKLLGPEWNIDKLQWN